MIKNYVTGASGFLGGHLIKSLKGGIEPIFHKEIATKTLKPFSHFYFLSTYGNMSFHKETDKILQANVSDLIHIIKQAVKFDFKSFVFISTSSVKLSHQTMYSRTKRAAEEILLSFTEQFNLPICIVQPYSITGVGEQSNHLIPTLIRSCYEGELVNFVPEPTHDFIDVEDVIHGIGTLSQKGARGIFELGSGKKYSNQDVLRLVEAATGKKANINKVDYLRPYDNLNWVSNNFKARGHGWLPKKSLKKSITEMVAEYEQTRKKGN